MSEVTDDMVRAGQGAFLRILEQVSWPARVERMKGSLDHVCADQLVAAYKAMRKLDPKFQRSDVHDHMMEGRAPLAKARGDGEFAEPRVMCCSCGQLEAITFAPPLCGRCGPQLGVPG